MRPRYTTSHVCFESMPGVVRSRIEPGMSVCEIGGGANPLLSREERDGLQISYTVIDIDGQELAKAPDDVRKIELDITSTPLPSSYDIVISMHLAEHVRDPRSMHRHVRAMLQPGGVAIHFFPTLYTAPFTVNRLLPERLAQLVLLRLQPYRVNTGTRGKFPAYCRWCRGPTRRQQRRMISVGFEVDEYIGGFGHAYYCRVPALQRLEDAKTHVLLRHPIAGLTSYAILVLRRPR